MSNTEVALTLLRDNKATIRHMESEQPALVEAARKAGATWQQIGDALGISRQAAHERFKEGER